ncbi:MAG: FecR domain-containing protein [Gammaproteobacteria bacterium]|nr:FecR domain-containing protein [Gammaproteobacteria bacterium]
MSAVKFPNLEIIENCAADWVAKIDRGLSAREEVQLSQWLEESPVHGETLVKCASMWDLLDVLSPIAKLMPMEKLKLENGSNDTVVEYSARYERKVSTSGFWGMFATAAATVAVVLGINNFKMAPADSLSAQIAGVDKSLVSQTVGKVYKTAIGERSTVKLADGSVLELNTNSEVSVLFTKSQRQIELVAGEVYFDVAKDPTKPFVVDVGSDQVVAIGTAFNIDARPGLDKEVLVTEGKVKVSMNSLSSNQIDELFLTKGQKVTIGPNESKVRNDQDTEALLSWRDGMLVFQGQPLEEAIREIDRYTPLSFTIMDESIAVIPVGGYFKTGDTEQLLKILELNFGVQSKRIGDEVLLYTKVTR